MEHLTSQKYRDFVDALRRNGVDRFVSLPQVIVVGDQSSGKSSVLTALGGVFEFPSSASLTTRCACQVTMTRSENSSASVCRSSLPPSSAEIINDRKEICAAIARVQQEIVSGASITSNEHIVIHLSGPDLPDVTLIDLPGIFRTLKEGQTAVDRDAVRSMVVSFMQQTRTLILAVVPANQDMQNCEVIQLAREVDPKLERSLCVLTKPDLVERGTDAEVLRSALAMRMPLHVVRCRGKEDRDKEVSPIAMREMEKQFFDSKPEWKAISHGVHSLQERLSELLHEQVRRELPKVQKELEEKLKEADVALEELGEDLSQEVSRRLVYHQTLDKVKSLTDAMVAGNYNFDPIFFRNTNHRLRSIVRELVENFNHDIICANAPSKVYEKGDTVISKGEKHIVEQADAENVVYRVGKEEIDTFESTLCSQSVKSLDSATVDPHLQKIMRRIRCARGRELAGFLSFDVFLTLLNEEIEVWRPKAVKLIETCFDRIASNLVMVANASTKTVALGSYFCGRLKALSEVQRQEGFLKIKLLFDHEKIASTQNHYFSDRLLKSRAEPLLNALKKLKPDEKNMVSIDAVQALVLNEFSVDHDSNELREAREMACILEAYLGVAKKRFIDNMEQLLNMCLNIVAHAVPKALQMSEADLSLLLNESRQTASKRALFKLQADTCRKALNDFERFS